MICFILKGIEKKTEIHISLICLFLSLVLILHFFTFWILRINHYNFTLDFFISWGGAGWGEMQIVWRESLLKILEQLQFFQKMGSAKMSLNLFSVSV